MVNLLALIDALQAAAVAHERAIRKWIDFGDDDQLAVATEELRDARRAVVEFLT